MRRAVWGAVWLVAVALAPMRAAAQQVEVVDDLGERVRLAAPPRRIVSLAPHATELVFAVGAGARLVGAMDHSDYPPAARQLPRVGDSRSIDLEAVAALKPDLVIVWPSGNSPSQVERLAKMGLPVYRSEPRRLSEIADAMRRLGVLLGEAEAARVQAQAFERELTALRRQQEGKAPVRTFYQVWPQPLMTLNDQHLASDVIRLCGGVNVLGALAPLVPTVSTEAVLAAAPELILVSAPPASAQAAQQIQAWRRFGRVAAVAHGQVRAVDPDLLNRPTPRILLGAREVCEALDDARRVLGRR
ncbi:cobalamin-binding protein [Schlegelella aquatica]|uniref:cobalamin-binding protein n=1 Tax=Caldimonas aquatica TaxID=376175 RepID=UPI0037536562